MYKLDAFFGELDKLAPLNISKTAVEKGCHDNSGIIVKAKDTVSSVLFSLDLTLETVMRAKRLKCDLIVTHHPAIFYPISNLSIDGENKALLLAIKENISVISMHLNLDFAVNGIDACLATGIGAKNYKIISKMENGAGYGREGAIEKIKLSELVLLLKKKFNTNKIISYGKKGDIINSVASFCGAGGEDAVNYVKNCGTANAVISSDLKHNQIVSLIDAGKSVIVIPHYVAEEYGFNIFYTSIKEKLNNQVKVFYFDDKRLR